MSDQFEAQWEERIGALTVFCEPDGFSRLVQGVVNVAKPSEPIDSDQIRSICIYNFPKRKLPKRTWHDGAALFGCAVISIVLFVVFSAGVGQIVTWFRA